MRGASFHPVGIFERIGLALSTLGLTPPPLPQPFYESYIAPLGARALISSTRLGVIASLGERPASCSELARALELHESTLELVLGALLNLGYVRLRRDGRFALKAAARRWLLPGSWDAVTAGLAHDGWDQISHLDERLRGGPTVPWHERPAEDPMWATYQLAMAQLARPTADALARAIPVRSPRTLLDLGGSHGLQAAAMCRRHSGLQATVMDLAPAVAFGRELIAEEGMSGRVIHREGDIFQAPLGENWDVLTAHSLLHNFGPERCLTLLRRARQALAPKGLFAALEIERPATGRRGMRVGALSSLLFNTFGDGRCYRPEEVRGMLIAAGFSGVRVKRPLRLPANFLAIAYP
jgi:DNA-binding transcriptional ArsR family regulator